jgi:hypothetical protein
VTPPKDLNEETLAKIEKITLKIAKALHVKGPFNMQLIAKGPILRNSYRPKTYWIVHPLLLDKFSPSTTDTNFCGYYVH